jgi:hypothetical protein
VNRDIRSVLIGGLAATFVVAASLAPKVVDRPAEVTVHNSAADATLDPTTGSTDPTATSTTEATTSTTVPPTTTTTGDLPTRVGGLEQRVTRIESTTTTIVAAKPDVTFYFEATVGIGPDAEAAPDDDTWKVVFRTTKTEPGLRVPYLAQTKNGPAEFTAEFSDLRPHVHPWRGRPHRRRPARRPGQPAEAVAQPHLLREDHRRPLGRWLPDLLSGARRSAVSSSGPSGAAGIRADQGVGRARWSDPRSEEGGVAARQIGQPRQGGAASPRRTTDRSPGGTPP